MKVLHPVIRWGIILTFALLTMSVARAETKDPTLLEGKQLAGLHVCETDAMWNLKHGGKERLCLLFLDPEKKGKRWYAIYGEGSSGQLESIVEGDDATVTWKLVWRKGQLEV